MHGPLPAPFLDAPTTSCPVLGRADLSLLDFGCADPFFARTLPFWDTRTPSCPIFGCADPFSPGIILFWTHEPLPALFLAALTLSRPELSLFGHTNPCLPPFWTCRPLPAPFCPFLDIRTPFCPLFGHADHFLPD